MKIKGFKELITGLITNQQIIVKILRVSKKKIDDLDSRLKNLENKLKGGKQI